ncbi:hypothetical protein IF1G_03727 [Cordyceps javanica]|uniref:Uncharacterized protein n=1 Tax=Cordyceps javanica TaxID=43265 RepID=A0A545V8C6_9HYPO|nr:hypothetical protein IF1G_03727 [Cordyceps javanica]
MFAQLAPSLSNTTTRSHRHRRRRRRVMLGILPSHIGVFSLGRHLGSSSQDQGQGENCSLYVCVCVCVCDSVSGKRRIARLFFFFSLFAAGFPHA